MRKKTLFVAVILILFITFLFFGAGISKVIGNAILDARAIFDTASLSLTILCNDSSIVPASGNLTFTEFCAYDTITEVIGADPGWEFNLGLYGGNYPPEWIEPEPIENETNDPIKYFELNTSTGSHEGGNYILYFNLSQNVLGSINPDNVSLFVYVTNWTELNTVVINGTSDPARFYSDLTHFSKFLIGEKPVVVTEEPPVYSPSPGGGGGGGSSTTKKNSSFSLDKDIIKVSMRQGDTKKEFIKIKNTDDVKLDIKVDLTGLEDFIIFPGGVGEYYFELEPGKEKTIQLIFSVSSDQKPETYFGKIVVNSGDLKSIITTILEVESVNAIFDVETHISERFREVPAGGILVAEVSLFNLERVGLTDVLVNYYIKDLEGNIILQEQETVGVETKVSYIKEFDIPIYLKTGDYLLYVSLDQDGIIASSSHAFKVVEINNLEWILSANGGLFFLIGTVILLLLAVLFMIHEHRKLNMLHKSIKKIGAKEMKKKKLIK
ncbi:MAG: hypothetical protein KJ906_03420 [Nanoarchaeota archaeon]|nr:hypothetical protein [Nanoarchaeota archaeon]